MNVDVSKLQFYSPYPIDKIIQEGTFSYVFPVGVPQSFPPYPFTLQSIPNNLAQKALIKGSWSIDGVNFNSTLSQLQYFSVTYNQPILKASVNLGVSANSIFFYITNNFTSNLTFTIKYAVYTIS